MIISVLNFSNGRIRDDEVRRALRAINRQIKNDFEPHWGFGATLRLVRKAGSKLRKQSLPGRQGEAYLYLSKTIDLKDAQGYHNINNHGTPYGLVLIDMEIDPQWTATLSHEALELVGDPLFNLLVKGPSPKDHRLQVYHWFEMCDAVQDEFYEVDKLQVSNFVLPRYFDVSKKARGPCDFLGNAHAGMKLQPFGTNPGGYINFFDPHARRNREYARPDDKRAEERKAEKRRCGVSRSTRRACA